MSSATSTGPETLYRLADSVDTNLIETARRIGPVLRDHIEDGEREGRLPLPTLKALSDAGLLSMLTPRSLGGLEVDPITYARVVEEVSIHDTSAGWTLTNSLLWAFLCARLPDQGAQDVLRKDPRALMAATISPPLKAVPVDGGYRISGRGTFASNCHHAVWIGAACVVDGGRQPPNAGSGGPEMIWAYMPAEDCRILDTWHVMGMKGTGSNDIQVDESLVPEHRTFPFVPEFVLGPKFKGPLYRFPFLGMASAALPPVMLGVARAAIDEVTTLAQGKTPAGSPTTLRERPATHAKLGQAEAGLRSARALLYETLAQTWETTLRGDEISMAQRADLVLASVNAATRAAQAVELMYSLAGTTGIYSKSPLERFFRDTQVARQHRFYTESRYETFGRMYFGLNPDYFLVLL